MDPRRFPGRPGLGRAATRGRVFTPAATVARVGMGNDRASAACFDPPPVAIGRAGRACHSHHRHYRIDQGFPHLAAPEVPPRRNRSYRWCRGACPDNRGHLGGGVTRPADAPIAVEPAPFADSGEANGGADKATPTPRPTRTPTPTPTPVTTTREEIVTEAIAFDQTTLEDANLPRGQTVISVGGQAGQRTLTYVITLVDGVETGRELKSDVVTVAPVTEVTAIGTYDAPVAAPAPPAASGCDSNYADACVPIASDVDCAWGTGDGPAYFDGVARVVGSDVYGLDRNNDGWACEQ